MCEKGVRWILRELVSGRQAKPHSDALDVDDPKIEVPKAAPAAPGSIV